MSEQEKFIERWSRRKQESAERTKDSAAENTKAAEISPDGENSAEQAALPARVKDEEPPAFDPKSLPSIDSIVATTDIRPFLAPGVPPELTRAALRQAWVTDSAIRDFVGLQENSWDFNDPNGALGFGPLQVTEEMKQAVAEMLDRMLPQAAANNPAKEEDKEGRDTESEPAGQAGQIAAAGERNTQSPQSFPVPSGSGEDNFAEQQNSAGEKDSDSNRQRGHGGALPK